MRAGPGTRGGADGNAKASAATGVKIGIRIGALNWARALVAVSTGLALAIVLGSHAISLALTKAAPEQALRFSSVNGSAIEALAFERFRLANGAAQTDRQSGVPSSSQGAREVVDLARRALRQDPLAPKALAILAISETNAQRRAKLLDLGRAMNRRDLTLQGVVLQEELAKKRLEPILITLDELLRVHPDRYDELLPLLVEALASPDTLPIFEEMLSREADWHRGFFERASRAPDALAGLAELRRDIAVNVPGFDRRLIAGLVRQEDYQGAQRLYTFLSRESQSADPSLMASPWVSRLPPFDWTLAETRALRAQPSRDGSTLELFVRGGEGGRMAARVMPAPGPAFSVSLNLETQTRANPARSDPATTRLAVRCAVGSYGLIDARIALGTNRFVVERTPEGCDQIVVEIFARVLRGHPTFRGRLSGVQLDPIAPATARAAPVTPATRPALTAGQGA